MKQLLGDSTTPSSDGFLRELFLQRLPRNVQMVLATASTLPTDELASLADAVIEVATPSLMHVDALSTASTDHTVSQDPSPRLFTIDSLSQQVSHLTSLVAALTARSRSPSPNPRRYRRRSPAPGRRRTRSRSTQSDGVCWYHHRFGADAHHCLQPCSWTGNAPASH